MGLRSILFGAVLLGCSAGVIISPVWPLCGYILHYSTGPENQWWASPINALGIRYSFTLAIFIAAGIVLHWGKFRPDRALFTGQEKLLLVFLGVVWLSVAIGPDTVGRYTVSGIDHPSVKFTKIVIFTLMLTHVAIDRTSLNRVLWAMIVGALILGLEAYETPYRAFRSGRLNSVGGPDFAEANFFAAYMASMLWLIGVQFLRSDWRGKLFCFLAGGFTANAIILTRSRGAVVGLAAGGLIALCMAPREYRKYIIVGLILGGAGFLYLTDDQWHTRTSTILAKEEERDSSAQSRIVLAKAGVQMWLDHPLGVGAGNFYQNIGRYVPENAGKDAHNTFIRCLAELGIQGLVVFGLIIAAGFATLRRTGRRATAMSTDDRREVLLLVFGFRCALATMCVCCLTISLTYVEFVWWFLLLPVCLERMVNSIEVDAHANLNAHASSFLIPGKRPAEAVA